MGPDELATFSAVDYVVFLASLTISVGIGVYQWWVSRGRGTEDFLLGGGAMNPIPVALSLMAGIVSAISILGNSSEMYFYGSQLWANCGGVVVGGVLVAVLMLPVLYPLKCVSIFQYMQERWGSPWLRKSVMILQTISAFFYLGIALYAPSLALSSVTPIPTHVSVLVLGAVCTVYASIGGAKAVVYTDTFQTVVMVAGVVAVVVQGCAEVGGGANAWQIDQEHGRIEFFNMDPRATTRHTFMTTVVLGMYLSVSLIGAAQAQYQRWASVATLKHAYIVVGLNVVFLVGLWSLINYSGLVVFAVYADCDPYTKGWIEKPDQITAYFVVDKLGYLAGVPGLFVAAVYSGVLSSVSSQLNAIAAVVWEDFLRPLQTFAAHTPQRAKNVNVAISVCSGVLATGVGVLAGSMGGLVQVAYSIGGALGGPITGLFLAGILCPWVTLTGAVLGFVSSLGLNLWMVMGSFLYAPPPPMLPLSTEGCPDNTTMYSTTALPTDYPLTSTTEFNPPDPAEVFPLYLVSYALYGAIGTTAAFVVANVSSLVLGPTEVREVPERAVNLAVLRWYAKVRGVKDYPSPATTTGVLERTKGTEEGGLDNPIKVDDSL